MASERFEVLIVGGGVAALEAALALREFAGERFATTILAPEREFVVRPMTVREPFGYATARRYPVARVAADAGAEVHPGSFKWLDPEAGAVHTEGGEELAYDALLLCLGAKVYARYPHAITIDDHRLDEQLHGLIQDIEGGFVRSLAFIVPSGRAWPFPAYELALNCAARAYDTSADLTVTIATPEDAPLAIFGQDASEGVREILREAGVEVITSAHCEVPEAGRVVVRPRDRVLEADRVIAVPELRGPAVPGIPAGHEGFIPVDTRMRVRGRDRVWAAGDATDFAIKFGGIAAQQADVAAQSIAASAGLAPEPGPFHPVIRGMLFTGGKPRHIGAHVTGGHGSTSYFTDTPPEGPPAKIAASHLAPYLDEIDREAGA